MKKMVSRIFIFQIDLPDAPQSPHISVCARDLMRDMANRMNYRLHHKYTPNSFYFRFYRRIIEQIDFVLVELQWTMSRGRV